MRVSPHCLAGAAVRAGFTPLLQLQEGVRLPSRHQYTRFPAPLHATRGLLGRCRASRARHRFYNAAVKTGQSI